MLRRIHSMIRGDKRRASLSTIADTPIGHYQSYLVRLWQAHGHAEWRASARHIQTGETIHFATLASLFAFLEAQTDTTPLRTATAVTDLLRAPSVSA